ncbi:MAG: hypothetical protein QME85_03400 [Candidatus Saccharicenans sp.]|nr:hypothetical protein [Candidatus Saccharicenans sp.]MDI6849034.1 hypothetical protein [Candidatus Saccharicenans sp.]
MKERARKAKRLTGVLAVVLTLMLLPTVGLALQAQEQEKPVWEFGLTGELYARGIKWSDQTTTLKSTNLMFELRARNLGHLFNLSFFGGLGLPRPNGVVFDQLPLTLEYQGGSITGLLFGARAEARLLPASDFNFGLMAEFTSCLGFKKDFALSGLVVPATATATPSWSQASGGLRVTYDALEGSQPFLEAAGSYFWGQFKMKEKIEDLEGEQKVELKGASYVSITAGWSFFLVDKITLVPKIRIFPGSRTTISGLLSIYYGF